VALGTLRTTGTYDHAVYRGILNSAVGLGT